MGLDHILLCGLGSIGQRHLRHFRRAGVRRIDAYRTGRGTLDLPDDIRPDNQYDDLAAALARGPQAVVVANPTSHHVEVASAAASAGAHLLIEKPLSHDLDGCAELITQARTRQLVVAAGCNFRFHPLIGALRRIVRAGELGKPVMARAHFGAWLPGWHPWEDYRSSYAARRDLGGGARLTHIHEIDYLLWILGPAQQIVGDSIGFSVIDTDVDEASACVLRHASGVLSVVSLRLCQRPASRIVHVAFESGTVEVDLINGAMITRPASGDAIRFAVPNDFDIDHTYEDQTQAFIDAVAGGPTGNLCTGTDALAALRVALGARP